MERRDPGRRGERAEPRPVVGDGSFQLVAFPPAGATGIAPETSIKVAALNGRITKLTIKGPDGVAVPGYLDRRRRVVADRGAPRPRHHVRGERVVIPTKGKAHRERWSFSTVAPRGRARRPGRPGGQRGGRRRPADRAALHRAVANKAEVEKRLKVTTSVPVEGSWRWISDRETHWRPRDYWPANTEVFFDADLNGVDAGNGVFGNVHRTAHFRIGNSHVSIADSNNHTLTVYENGGSSSSSR